MTRYERSKMPKQLGMSLGGSGSGRSIRWSRGLAESSHVSHAKMKLVVQLVDIMNLLS